MQENDLRLAEESFRRYYFEHIDAIEVPEEPSKHEFGYQKFNSGMIRHLAISGKGELRSLIIQNSPSDVYCSNGYYSFPNLPMDEKEWQGADLIFDIDSKDLGLSCRADHTLRRCTSCCSIFRNDTTCTVCTSPKYDMISLPCRKCINGTKEEVEKLLGILVDDLGVMRDTIRVYFSGNEGFHIHVHDGRFMRANGRERGELVDYIMFRGAIPERYGMGKSEFPDLAEPGMRGRVAKQIFKSRSKRRGVIKQIQSAGPQAFVDRLEDAACKIGSMIDPNVTTDIHRIFRLPGSLNGKSGMAKIPCSDLKGFNPYEDACMIDTDMVSVTAHLPCVLKLGGRRFGPYEGNVEVPRFAAVYMICKGLASAV